MIHSLCLKNFKCFEEQSFRISPLTILTGLNGMGKSSVLQSLLLLRQSEQGLRENVGLSLNGDLVQMGTARDVFYEGASSDQFGFKVEFEKQLDATWNFKYDRSADVARLLSSSISEKVYENSLFKDNFHYLQAERIGPRVSFPTSDFLVRQHRQIGSKGEYTFHYLSLFGDQDIAQLIMAHPKADTMSLQRQTEAWMSEVSPGVRLDITVFPEMDIVNLRYNFANGGQVSNYYRSTNVGFGITYTLPVIVALLSAVSGGLVLLENPEAHLHPLGQVKIAELIARAASCGIQIIMETHSDHIINGIRLAVHDNIVPPELVSIYFLGRGKNKAQGTADVISPRINHDGRIDQWPEGFFDEWDKSLERLLKPTTKPG